MERFFVETKVAISDAGEISGIAWPFGSADRIGDIIEKGAFAGTPLPLPMLFGHDLNDPVGVWKTASEETGGLMVTGSLLVNDLPRAREVQALVKAGAVRGLSVGFTTKKAAPRQGGGRVISALELMEISLVVVPMHPGARVTAAKSIIQAINLADAIKRTATAIQTRK